MHISTFNCLEVCIDTCIYVTMQFPDTLVYQQDTQSDMHGSMYEVMFLLHNIRPIKEIKKKKIKENVNHW